MRGIPCLLALWMAVSVCLPVRGEEPALINEVLQLLGKSGVTFDEGRAWRAAADALVRSADPLGGLLNESQYQQLKDRHNGRVYDAGIRLMYTNSLFKVRLMEPGGPAPRAGVKTGDTLLTINGRSLAGHRFTEAIEQLRASEEKTLVLKLKDKEGGLREVELNLRIGQLDTIELVEHLPEGIGYIKLNGLYKNGAEDLVDRIRIWDRQKKFGLIIDLRNANGRDLATVKSIAELLTQPNSPLFTFQNTPLNQTRKFESGETKPVGLPIMLLVNARTSGAAELLVATLQGSGLGAMVLGETTAGDFALRQFVKLESGDYLYVATYHLLMGDGTVYDGSRGVQPDVEVADVNIKKRAATPDFNFSSREPTVDEDRTGELIKQRTEHDAVMQRAIDVLLGLKALNIRVFGKAR